MLEFLVKMSGYCFKLEFLPQAIQIQGRRCVNLLETALIIIGVLTSLILVLATIGLLIWVFTRSNRKRTAMQTR